VKHVLVAFLICLTACSTNSMSKKATERNDDAHAKMSGGALSEEQMQSAWKKAATPTAEHAFLKEFVGNWKTTTKWWMAPDSKPEVTKGRAVNTMELGGKFLRQSFKGSMMGHPFSGIGYTGYDTVNKEFTSVWMDSMSTAMMTSTGSYNPTTKALTLVGEASCPMVEGKIHVRMVERVVSANKHIFEFYSPAPNGGEFRSLEIEYIRSK
jgi:Protein of unknown function (DUF1579)